MNEGKKEKERGTQKQREGEREKEKSSAGAGTLYAGKLAEAMVYPGFADRKPSPEGLSKTSSGPRQRLCVT